MSVIVTTENGQYIRFSRPARKDVRMAIGRQDGDQHAETVVYFSAAEMLDFESTVREFARRVNES